MAVVVEERIAVGAFDTMQVRYNLMYQHVSDWHNDTGVIRQAKEQGMGVILMRVSTRCGSWTSGVFQRLMAEAFPEIDTVSRDGAGGGRFHRSGRSWEAIDNPSGPS